MMIVNAVSAELMKPRRGFNVFAAVFVPFYVWFVAQHACVAFANVGDGEKRADVHSHAIVEVGIPTDGLFFERFPADEDVVGRVAFENQFEFFL